jgi:hypothetical protein
MGIEQCMARPHVPVASAPIALAEGKRQPRRGSSAGGHDQKAGSRPACALARRASQILTCCELKASPVARSRDWREERTNGHS